MDVLLSGSKSQVMVLERRPDIYSDMTTTWVATETEPRNGIRTGNDIT